MPQLVSGWTQNAHFLTPKFIFLTITLSYKLHFHIGYHNRYCFHIWDIFELFILFCFFVIPNAAVLHCFYYYGFITLYLGWLFNFTLLLYELLSYSGSLYFYTHFRTVCKTLLVLGLELHWPYRSAWEEMMSLRYFVDTLSSGPHTGFLNMVYMSIDLPCLSQIWQFIFC